MSVLTEIEEKAMTLPKKERSALAHKLFESLGPPFVAESDEELLAEAKLRDKEMDENPAMVMTEEEFWASLEDFRRR